MARGRVMKDKIVVTTITKRRERITRAIRRFRSLSFFLISSVAIFLAMASAILQIYLNTC